MHTAICRFVGTVSAVTDTIADLVDTNTLLTWRTEPVVRPAFRAARVT